MTRSRITGKVRIGVTVIVSSSSKSESRHMHISRGLPLTSALHEPHLPALQFQRTARSPAWVRLHPVDRVEHDLALGDLDRVVLELAAVLVAAPDAQLQVVAHVRPLTGSSKYFLSSSGITGSGFSCRSTPVPSAFRLTTRFLVPHSAFGPGKSSRV